MANPKILDEIGSKVSELLASSPAKDIEKNARALLASGFSKLDLVTRDEFEVQREVLARTREKLADLETPRSPTWKPSWRAARRPRRAEPVPFVRCRNTEGATAPSFASCRLATERP
jgi:hypothetical protein